MSKKIKPDDKKRIAVLRVRGKVHVREDITKTLNLLNLTRVNHCVIVDNRPQYRGMITEVNDYVTWGEINEETLNRLFEGKGKLEGDIDLTNEYIKDNTNYKSIEKFTQEFMKFSAELKDIPNLKPVFRLNPPKKGYERRGIKKPFSLGGALGYRGEEINGLLERMI